MRTAITILAITIGLLVAVAVFRSQQKTAPPITPTTASTEVASDAPAATPQPAANASADGGSATQPAAPQTPATAPQQVTPIDGLHVATATDPATINEWGVLGSNDANADYKMRVKLTAWGAAVGQIRLTDYQQDVRSSDHYLIVNPVKAAGYTVYPYAARAVTINGQTVDLQNAAWSKAPKRATDAGESLTYRLTIADAKNQPVLELVRTYQLGKDSYDLALQQYAINRTGQALQVQWQQNIQGDLVRDASSYLGDRRMFASGYFAPVRDPGKVSMYSKGTLLDRTSLVKETLSGSRATYWPNPDLDVPEAQLTWVAAENRYFTVVTHPRIPESATKPAEIPALQDTFPTTSVVVFPDSAAEPEATPEERAMVLTMSSRAQLVQPGERADLSMSVYAGPRKSDVFAQQPYAMLGLKDLIRYELGCTWLTSQILAKGLLNFLKGLHWVVHDWGVAIIILVAVVRLLLHPITKRAQVNMMKMGKQMQTLQPEMEKLKKKYKDDQPRLNQEMMKLYREKGVNPANALGCLPMFLQTPIWIALYAMLYFAIELRHQPAFYGIFQAISGGHWQFLADLSSADHFIKFANEGFTLNLLFVHPHFSGINILPILMAVVFFFQQKLTTPPPANEQAAQQQKMMRFMVLLFPVFLYSAPSGLTLYILASTTAGVVDSYIVRRHVKQQEEAGLLFVKKERKPGGFMDRLSKAMEEKQKQMAQMQQPGKGKGNGKRKR